MDCDLFNFQHLLYSLERRISGRGFHSSGMQDDIQTGVQHYSTCSVYFTMTLARYNPEETGR